MGKRLTTPQIYLQTWGLHNQSIATRTGIAKQSKVQPYYIAARAFLAPDQPVNSQQASRGQGQEDELQAGVHDSSLVWARSFGTGCLAKLHLPS